MSHAQSRLRALSPQRLRELENSPPNTEKLTLTPNLRPLLYPRPGPLIVAGETAQTHPLPTQAGALHEHANRERQGDAGLIFAILQSIPSPRLPRKLVDLTNDLRETCYVVDVD